MATEVHENHTASLETDLADLTISENPLPNNASDIGKIDIPSKTYIGHSSQDVQDQNQNNINKNGRDKTSNDDNDECSITSYQPSVDSESSSTDNNDKNDSYNKNGNNNNIFNKFTRQMSREDATSIIGGIKVTPIISRTHSIVRPKLSNRLSNVKILDSSTSIIADMNKSNNNSISINLDKSNYSTDPSLVTLNDEKEENNLVEVDNINEDENENENDEEDDEENALSEDDDQTRKVFNFSFPFSTANNESVDETNIIQDVKSSLSKLSKHKRFYNHNHVTGEHRYHRQPHLLIKLRNIKRILPFYKKNSSSLLPKQIPIKRPYYPQSPDPPPDVNVYWNEISNVNLDDEEDERYRIGLKLKRQQSLDTIEEAKYYRDISSLDDGKFKALANSLLINKISTKISQKIISKQNNHDTTAIYTATETSITTTRSEFTSRTNTLPLPREATASPISNTSTLPSSLNMAEQNTSIDHSVTESKNNSILLPTALVSTTKNFFSIPMSPVVSTFQVNTTPPGLEIFDEIDGDVIILGGYRGSILRDSKTKRSNWIPVIEAGLNIRKINLVLGPNDEDELKELNSRETIFGKSKNTKLNLDPSKFNDENYPTMYPDGMLTHIGPVDISKKLLKRLNSNPRVNARTWGYDWRLSPELISEQLHKDIEKLVSKQKIKKGVILIAHSMGGIVAHGAMVKDPSLIRAMIYAGTPMPCCNILGPIRFSDSILLSRDVLSNEANFFMRSSYVFLPPSWGGEDKDGNNGGMTLFRDLRDGKRYKIDFWNIKNWVLYNLSPLVSSVRLKHDVKSGIINLHKIKDLELKNEIGQYLKIKIDPKTEDIVTDEINRLSDSKASWIDSYNYLKRTLSRTKRFLKSLERKDDIKYPPMAQVFSNGVPSVKYCLIDGKECIKRGEYYKFFYGPGDGVVYQGWNFPRERGRCRPDDDKSCGINSAYPYKNDSNWRGKEYGYGEKYEFDLCGRFRGKSGHIGLLSDLKLIGKALNAVFIEERNRFLNESC
jgi:hypothetical protein